MMKTCQPKACDLDPMPTSLLLMCIDSLLTSLTYLINNSVQSATFPSEFKTLVKPLLKKHNLNPNQLKNYRPVLNLPFLSKLLEKIVLSQLTEHLNKNKLGYIFQSAYRHGDSTSLCAQWPPCSLWLWQSFCSDLIGPVDCIWHDRPPHSSRSSPKLLWYFWFCSQLVLSRTFQTVSKSSP